MNTHQPTLFDEPPKPPRDICAGRHGGNESSQVAFSRIRGGISQAQAEVLNWLREHGPGTAKEYAAATGKALNAVSGRFSELKRKLLIVPTGQSRDDSAECRAVSQ